MLPRAGFDFETKLIKPGLLAPPPVCLTWRTADELEGCHAQLDRKTARDRLEWFFSEFTLFGANTAYDAAVAMAAFPELVGLIFEAYAAGRVRDVQLDQMLIDNAKGELGGYKDHTGRYRKYGYSLGALSERHLAKDRSVDKNDPDAWRLRYGELWEVPWSEFPDKARDYALEDSDDTYEVSVIQEPAGEVLVDSAAQARAGLALHLMSCWGIKTDPENIRAYEKDVKERLEELDDLLVEEGLVRKNGSRNTKAAKKLMIEVCEREGLPIKLTKTGVEKLMVRQVEPGDPTVDWSLVEKYTAMDADACEETHDEILEAYAERTSLYTVKSSKIPALWKGVDAPIQARFNPLVASGRTSCSMGKGGPVNGYQLQNPERKGPVRECFVARDGMYYADADLDTFELCTVSQVCIWVVGFSHLGDAINAGLDPHLDLAAKILGISYEEAVARRAKGDPEVENARQGGKVANFGFPGGLGIDGFRAFARSGYGLKLSVVEAETLKEGWSTRWSEFPLYFQWVKNHQMDALGSAHVVQFISKRQRGLCPFTVACNSYFQGLAADAAKYALWEVTRRSYDPTLGSVLYGARPVNFVHDQILSEVDEEIAHEQAIEMGRVMVDACNEYLPDVPTSSEPALSKHWCKDVKAVYDAPPADGGRLVPWDIAKAERRRVFRPNGKVYEWAA